MNVVEYESLNPSQKKAYIEHIYRGFRDANAEGRQLSARSGQTQGYAFLWIGIGKSNPLEKAFRRYLKKVDERKVFRNYRYTDFAWYFGSQSDLGIYDGLQAGAKYLNEHGVGCYVCDEWD